MVSAGPVLSFAWLLVGLLHAVGLFAARGPSPALAGSGILVLLLTLLALTLHAEGGTPHDADRRVRMAVAMGTFAIVSFALVIQLVFGDAPAPEIVGRTVLWLAAPTLTWACIRRSDLTPASERGRVWLVGAILGAVFGPLYIAVLVVAWGGTGFGMLLVLIAFALPVGLFYGLAVAAVVALLARVTLPTRGARAPAP